MADSTPYVIVGASLAGAKAAEGAREAGYDGPIVLVGAEPELPYERPELSKGFLGGRKSFDELLVHDRAWYDEHGVELRLGTPVTRLDASAREVWLAGGERLRYGKALLATGAALRRLPVDGDDLAGVHYLRTVGDSQALRAAFAAAGRVVVVGAGWIGLETAAAARAAGCEVTIVEPQPTPLYGVLGAQVGALFADLHRRHGCDLRTGVGVEAFTGDGERVTGVVSAGEALPADVVVVGVGVRPDIGLASEAGLATRSGVVVDRLLRGSYPDVYAAGDVAEAENDVYGAHVRVEHWANAKDQGLAAGRSMAGAGEPWANVPFFYTDQYDLGMEYRGWVPDGYDDVVVRGDPSSGEYLVFWCQGGRCLAGMNVNVWDQGDAIQDLVRRRAQVGRARLADPAVPLSDVG